ncbi:MAG TPA: hypothetical protein PLP09_07130 [Petrotogaceae bacterium]|nr:hypothetical protein [Petrotogaceae bacterium]
MSLMESMGIMTSDGVYELLENGVYEAKLTSIVPYQRPSYNDKSKMENALKWFFETTTERTTKNTPFKISYLTSAYYTTSSKNRIRPFVQAVFGKILSVDEFKKLEESDLIGKEVQIIVKQNPSTTNPDKIYNNITEFLPKKKGNGKAQPVEEKTLPGKILPGTIQSINDLRDKLDMTPRAFYEFLSEQLKKKVSNIVNITEEEGKQIFYLLEAMVPMELPEENNYHEDASLDDCDVPF